MLLVPLCSNPVKSSSVVNSRLARASWVKTILVKLVVKYYTMLGGIRKTGTNAVVYSL